MRNHTLGLLLAAAVFALALPCNAGPPDHEKRILLIEDHASTLHLAPALVAKIDLTYALWVDAKAITAQATDFRPMLAVMAAPVDVVAKARLVHNRITHRARAPGV